MPVRILSLALMPAMLLGACSRTHDDGALLGTLEWDRVELIAEAAEPVLDIPVREGDVLAKDAVVMQLDARRAQAELARLKAEHQRLENLLSEQHNGARPEQIAEARARVAAAVSREADAKRELQRAKELRERKLNAVADLDRAGTTQGVASAETAAARAALNLLLAGTRSEQVAQTEAQLAAVQAQIATAELALERLTVRAPREARVDALALEVGDQPARGATVATLLVGAQPYARVYVPQRVRTGVSEGTRYDVYVQGLEQPFPGHVRQIQREPSFTPYYALQGDDASRLVYLAEIELEGDAARKLAAGLPLRALAKSDTPK